MFVFKVLFVRPPLDLPAEFSVWESDYFSKGVDHAKDSIRQSGELLYSEGYCPDGLASVYLDGETRSCDLGKITHGLREHAVRAFYALGTRLGDARVILPPSFGRHLGMSPGRHPLEEMRWVDVSSHLPGSGQDAGDWPDSGDAYDSDDVPF